LDREGVEEQVEVPEYEDVLLLPPLLILLHHDEGELLLLKVQPGDLGPKEEANLLGPLVYQNT
jgi:hypothetical protein